MPVGKGKIEEKKFNLKGKLGLLILKKWFYCKQKPKTFKNQNREEILIKLFDFCDIVMLVE